ncbi:MAG: acetolactate synthase large subunit [Sporichthyaceae bacterium]
MIGAKTLVRTLVDAGVGTCFTNPGTSEMHLVATLDEVPEFRGVLTLFEGVATGAADAWGRMTGTPAAALLHLGPGLGNGLANLHNARKAKVPLVVIVGDHATYHARHDAPLQSDIETIARGVSGWVRTSLKTEELGRDVADAVQAARTLPGQVATLILPADVSWSEGGDPSAPLTVPGPTPPNPDAVSAAARALRTGRPSGLLLGNHALLERELVAADRIAAATGATLLAGTFPSRLQRGAGIPAVERIVYLAEVATGRLAHLEHCVLVASSQPVSFFAYPGKPSTLLPEACALHDLIGPDGDVAAALEALAEELGCAGGPVRRAEAERPALPTGPLTADTVMAAVGATLPENAIVVDEALTSGFTFLANTAGTPAHDLLTLTGGAIGQGLPSALGAAVACPDRPVLALQADGSSLYTIQALWSIAREGLNVTTVLLNNRSYAILNMELNRVGAGEPGPKAREQFALYPPDLDFCALAQGFGVPASRPANAEEFAEALRRAYAEPGPHLIEARIPPLF